MENLAHGPRGKNYSNSIREYPQVPLAKVMTVVVGIVYYTYRLLLCHIPYHLCTPPVRGQAHGCRWRVDWVKVVSYHPSTSMFVIVCTLPPHP